ALIRRAVQIDDIAEALRHDEQRLAALLERVEMNDRADERRDRDIHAQPLDVHRAPQMLLFERVLRRRVNPLSSLKASKGADHRFAIARVADIERREAGKIYGDEIGWWQRANEIDERADHFERFEAADVVLVEKD